MPRPYWLLSLVPVIGGPLTFWLENRAAIKRTLGNARRGYDADGLGGGLVGVVAALGSSPSNNGGPGSGNVFGEAVREVSEDPTTDSRLKEVLREFDPDAAPPDPKPH
jgi:hypothetical protein